MLEVDYVAVLIIALLLTGKLMGRKYVWVRVIHLKYNVLLLVEVLIVTAWPVQKPCSVAKMLMQRLVLA